MKRVTRQLCVLFRNGNDGVCFVGDAHMEAC